MCIDYVHCFLNHRFIGRRSRASSAERGIVVFSELIAKICKSRFVSIGTLYGCFEIIEENGFCNASNVFKMLINAIGKVGCLLRWHGNTEDQSAKGQYANKNIAGNYFTGLPVYIAEFLSGKVTLQELSRNIFPVESRIAVFQIFSEQHTVLRVLIGIFMVLAVFYPEQLFGNTSFVQFLFRLLKMSKQRFESFTSYDGIIAIVNNVC